MTLVVLLFLNADRRAEFERYETAAAEIMKRHGGAIARRIVCSPGADESTPDEVHVVTFPDRDAFERYRNDPELRGLSDLRATAIRETVLWPGRDGARFGGEAT